MGERENCFLENSPRRHCVCPGLGEGLELEAVVQMEKGSLLPVVVDNLMAEWIKCAMILNKKKQ
jgi:hypothetical protein